MAKCDMCGGFCTGSDIKTLSENAKTSTVKDVCGGCLKKIENRLSKERSMIWINVRNFIELERKKHQVEAAKSSCISAIIKMIVAKPKGTE